ncbi:expressed unknown protein [Seminavis robusta]|uniref:Uncharacterized protein n=1 Tax=Seminavis robusta TaxID=568900 RepID=A0A9N8HDC4_9STRA|nr:expressed unknown protein [Seminavis robusta]|eukprot:Sro354_g124851.1  (133) ;mRNA; f:54806-55204
MAMDHLLTIYIRTKIFWGNDDVAKDGTVRLTRRELSKLADELGIGESEVDETLISLKCKGEIKGYGSNYKVTIKEGITQPELLVVTGEKKPQGQKSYEKVTKYVEKTKKGAGSRKFKEFLASKPMDKYVKKT